MQTGSYNTFVGGYAGQGGTTSAPFSSGQYNVAVGYQALDGFTTANQNVAVGYQALTDVTNRRWEYCCWYVCRSKFYHSSK